MRFVIKKDTPRLATNRHWQFCVGSGQAKLALRSDYARQLKFIHDELGIQRVRFHGIFDDSMQAYMGMDDFMKMPFSKNFKNISFHQIAAAYDNVIAAGMKPWVELSFMPSRLAKKQKRVTVNANGRATMPKDDKEWQDFIRQFINFLFHRYGKEEIETWFFEVWNEPNMSSFFKGSQKDYFHLYEITVKAIKSVDDKIKVGGPSSATSDWLPAFIGFCENNKLPLDFISTHHYPGDGIGEVFITKLIIKAVINGMKNLRKLKSGDALTGFRAMMEDKSETSEMAKGQMRQYTTIAKSQVKNYPLYYSEWNCNAILTSPSNDTRKAACFQVKSISEMEESVTGSSIWSFSDIFDEFLLFPNEFSGGFGLLTVSGIPKPQFYALKLMSQIGERKYALPYTNSEVEISAYESDIEKQLLVYRQRMKNVHEPAENYEIQLELEGSPSNVTISKIDEDHCNPLKVWQSMGEPFHMNETEIEFIKEHSKLIEEEIPFLYSDGVLTIENSIGINDIHCYKISF